MLLLNSSLIYKLEMPINYCTLSTIISFFVLFILISYFISTNVNNKKATVVPVCQHKMPLFQQSPEYRYPTKCFDCVREESLNHMNVAHGGRTSVGL